MGEKFGTRFFCPLLPGFSKKLLVPQEIVKHICTNEKIRLATIVTSNAKIWHVGFYREMEDTYIGGEGWVNFVKALGLRDFDMLVFRYHGNMVFTLRVFDKMTSCEKTYPYRYVEENMIFPDCDDDNHNSNIGPEAVETNANRKLLSFKATIKAFNLSRRNWCMEIPSEFVEAAGELLQRDALMLTDPKGENWRVGLSKVKKSHNLYMSKGWMKFARANKLKEGDRCTFELSPSSSQGKKRLMNVKIDQDDEMLEVAHFEVTVKGHNLAVKTGLRLYVPRGFTERTGLGTMSEVVLVDLEGRHWPVSLFHSLKRDGEIKDTFIKWQQFAVSNDVREGDRFLFEQLPKENRDVMRIQVRKI